MGKKKKEDPIVLVEAEEAMVFPEPAPAKPEKVEAKDTEQEPKEEKVEKAPKDEPMRMDVAAAEMPEGDSHSQTASKFGRVLSERPSKLRKYVKGKGVRY